MNKYYKIVDGNTIFYDPKEGLVIDGMIHTNPTHELLVSEGYDVYVEPEKSSEEQLQNRKDIIKNEILLYDSSDSINICEINYNGSTYPYWADKNERNALKNAVQDYMDEGREYYRLDIREYGISLSIPCEALIRMLKQLEVYAIDCYNTTSDHIYAVQQLDNVEDVLNYDYTTNYPPHLVFNI